MSTQFQSEPNRDDTREASCSQDGMSPQALPEVDEQRRRILKAFVLLTAGAMLPGTSSFLLREASAEPSARDLSKAVREFQKQYKKKSIGNFGVLDDSFQALVKIGNPEALEAILKTIAKPSDLREPLLALNYPLFLETFAGTDFQDEFKKAFTRGKQKSEDFSGLAFQVFKAWVEDGRDDALRKFLPQLKEHDNPFHFAAAVRALGFCKKEQCPENLQLASSILDNLPSDPIARNAWISASAYCIEGSCIVSEDYKHAKEILVKLAETLDHEGTNRPTKLAVGRMLSRVLKTPGVYTNKRPWIDAIEGADIREKLAREGYAVVEPRRYFFGQKIVGDRIVFVLDSTTSMNEEIDVDDFIETFKRRAVITGRPAKTFSDEDFIREFFGLERADFSKVKTKWDFVRVCLAATLEQLGERQKFEVVLFGDKATNIRGRDSFEFRSATDANKKSFLAQLKSARAHMTKTDPQLGIDTALQPFESPGRGESKIGHLLEHGADTIVMLTDGMATTDTYVPGESSTTSLNSMPHLGTYVDQQSLFRDLEIVCIGVIEEEVLKSINVTEVPPVIRNVFAGLSRGPRGRFNIFY